ncbi:MAG: response regulator [Candidatus Omnitrophota bacterium]
MPKKILIVEDHIDSREILVDQLEFSGYTVLEAGDGENGERIAMEETPDLIILDLSLPGKSGLDVVHSLRQRESSRHIPIIALTAHAKPEDEQKALEAGCISYIAKPVKPKEVLLQIEKILP